MTVITPLTEPNTTTIVALSDFTNHRGPDMIEHALCRKPGCNQPVYVSPEQLNQYLTVVTDLAFDGEPEPRLFWMHAKCADEMLRGMFDHFCATEGGCPFCGAEWQRTEPPDGSWWIEHNSHCIYEATQEAMMALADEDDEPESGRTIILRITVEDEFTTEDQDAMLDRLFATIHEFCACSTIDGITNDTPCTISVVSTQIEDNDEPEPST